MNMSTKLYVVWMLALVTIGSSIAMETKEELLIQSPFAKFDTHKAQLEPLRKKKLDNLANEMLEMLPGKPKEGFVRQLRELGKTVQDCVRLMLNEQEKQIIDDLAQEHGFPHSRYHSIKRFIDGKKQWLFDNQKPVVTFADAIPQEIQNLIISLIKERGFNPKLQISKALLKWPLCPGPLAITQDTDSGQKITLDHSFFRLSTIKQRAVLRHELEHAAQAHSTHDAQLSGAPELKEAIEKNKSKSYLRFTNFQEITADLLPASRSAAAARELEILHKDNQTSLGICIGQMLVCGGGISTLICGIFKNTKLALLSGAIVLTGGLLSLTDYKYRYSPAPWFIQNRRALKDFQISSVLRECIEAEERC